MKALVLCSLDWSPHFPPLFLEMGRLGARIEYACAPEFAPLLAGVVPCHQVHIRHKLDIPGRFRVKRLLRRGGFELLHTMTGRDGYAGLRSRPRRGFPVLVRRGAYPKVSRLDPHDLYIYSRWGATLHLVVSEDLKRHMVERGVPAGRIRVVYTGVWHEGYVPIRRDFRAEHSVPPDAFLLGFVGNYRPVKGAELLWDALAQVDVAFHVVVAGADHDPAKIPAAIRDRVTLLGVVPEIRAFTPNVDCLVVPSRLDALPRSVIEATVLGTPVIATRVGGIPEILDQGRGGWLVEPGDAAGLAAAIRQAALDPGLRRGRAEAALRRNRDLFSIARSARELVAIYESVLR